MMLGNSFSLTITSFKIHDLIVEIVEIFGDSIAAKGLELIIDTTEMIKNTVIQ